MQRRALVADAEQIVGAADGAIACFSSRSFPFSRNADRAPQLMAVVILLPLMLQPEPIGRNDVSERDLFLLGAHRISDVPSTLSLPSKYFGVLLACNARNIEDAVVLNLARSLVTNGMKYFCSWGSDCERVHDLVDSVIIENDETEDSVIITMWFEEKSLDEALWQFLYVAFPANNYEADCQADLAIVIGNSEWEEQIKKRLSDLDGLNQDVVGEDEEEDGGAEAAI